MREHELQSWFYFSLFFLQVIYMVVLFAYEYCTWYEQLHSSSFSVFRAVFPTCLRCYAWLQALRR